AFLLFLERPGWLTVFLVILAGVVSSFTKPVAAFACSLVALAGFLDRRARQFTLLIIAVFVAVVVLWSFRNRALYSRFIFSQVTDFNMAFFNYPALVARETGQDEWQLRDSLLQDFRQEVSDRGISGNDRAKSLLLAEKANSATGYMLSRPVAYALCHLSYLPRVLGSFSLPAFHVGEPGPRVPRPIGRPPEHEGPGPEHPPGHSVWGILNVGARVACLALAILGVPFWWRRRRDQAAGLIVGVLWFALSMGPTGEERTSLPAILVASVLAQGGWLAAKNWAKRKFIAGQGRHEL
ncbi:MAG: hypothetical protein ABIN58_13255, partial [candidate division WOR-3 bacterium]